MAFNPDAFNAGLGGILQQILSSRQQTQAMQQKRLDEEIPMYNQQRAWKKENSDIDWIAEERDHARNRRKPELDLLQGQVAGQKLTNIGQDINNDTAGVNLEEKIATSPATVKSAKAAADVNANNAVITGNQAKVSTAALPGATTEAETALPLKRSQALTAHITKRDSALAQMTAARKIVGDPTKTAEQQDAAIRDYIAAYTALRSVYGPNALEEHRLYGGNEKSFYEGLGIDSKHWNPLNNGVYRTPTLNDMHSELAIDPSLLRRKISPTGVDADAIVKSTADAIRGNYQPTDFNGTIPDFKLGAMPDFTKVTSTWNKGQQVERWIAQGGFNSLNTRLKEMGIDAQQFYKQRYGVDVSLTEIASGKPSAITRGKLKQNISFGQPENWEKDRAGHIEALKSAVSVFNDLNTASATTKVSKDNLLQAALGAFGQTGKTATAMYSQASAQIKSLVDAYAASARMSATEFLAQLPIMSTSVDPKLKQMANTILQLNKQMNTAQQSLIKAIAKGPGAFANNNEESQKAVEKLFSDAIGQLPKDFTGFTAAPAGGAAAGGGQRPAVNGSGAQVEQVELGGG